MTSSSSDTSDAAARVPAGGPPAAVSQALLVAALLALVVAALAFGLGRQGERIAAQMCVNVAAVLALGMFSGNTGIVSFGHAAFLALGAYLSGLLTMPAALQRSALPALPAFLAGHELSPYLALGIVLVFGLLVAALIGLPVARLTGASSTIATLGVLIIVHSVLVGARELTRGSQTFYGVPRTTDLALALATACAFVAAARGYRESRWGLAARAARDDAVAATAVGIDPRRARWLAWTLSGALATVAGALYGHLLGAFSPREFYFSLTFTLVAMLIVGGMTTVSGAVAGVVVVTLVQDAVRQVEGGVTLGPVTTPAVFGLTTASVALMMLVVLWRRPEGLLGVRELEWRPFTRLLVRLGTRSDRSPPVRSATTRPAGDAPGGGIVVRGLTKRFGGLTAVDDASFVAPPGTVTGLIGPNGAGKSTIVNLLTGQFRPSAGQIRFGEHDLATATPHGLARLGLARTFQNLRLFGALTARENVLAAALAAGAPAREAAALTADALERLDLTAQAGRLAAELPYGDRKRLEIARCLALKPSFVLLDEPAAGLNPEETSRLADRLSALASEAGIGMLLIDHDLAFVTRLSSSIVVVDRGTVIASGTPEAVRADPLVVEAYLGRARAARAPDGGPVPAGAGPSVPPPA